MQLMGLGLAAYGVSETRQTYAPDRPGIAGTVKRRLRPWYVRGRRWVRHPVPGKVVALGGAVEISAAMSARVAVRHGPLSATLTTAEKVDSLDQRTRAHREELNQLGNAIADERAARDADIKQLEAAMTGETEQRRREIAAAMAGGLRLESWGLGIAAVGTALGAFG